MLIGLVALMIEDLCQDAMYLLEEIWCHGEVKRQHVISRSTAQADYRAISLLLVAMIPCLTIGPKIKLANKMKKMRANLEEITKQHRDFSLTAGGGSNIEQKTDTRETSSAIEEALIVGRTKEKQKIVASLSANRTEELTILPIYGFGGMGKTTLAKLVFSDAQFNEYSRVWVYVSHAFDLKKIGNSIISQLSNGDSHITQRQLINRRLQELLAGKKVLVVLDDMWRDNDNECQVEDVRAMLRVGEGSKLVVLVTTRDEGLAEELCTIEPHKLAPLTNDMCWTIIKQRSAFESKDGKKQLEEIGRDIARKCGGRCGFGSSVAWIHVAIHEL